MNCILYFIISLLLLIYIVYTKEFHQNELKHVHNNKGKLYGNDYDSTFIDNILSSLINDSSNYAKSLPQPLKLYEDAYVLEIAFDGNQTTTGTIADKQRKLQPISLKYDVSSKFNNNVSSIDATLEVAARKGIDAMKQLYDEIEPNLLRKGHVLNPNHPGTFLSKFNAPNEITFSDEKVAYATLIATKYFQKSYKLRATEFGRQSSNQLTFRRTSLEGLCPPRESPICLPAALRYRTHDGTCNNIQRPRWGSALMPFNRFLPPDYEDGIDTIRQSIQGDALASARFISLVVHGDKNGNAPVTLMLAQWGQLIDHDLTSTMQPRSINGSIPQCCGTSDSHPSCLPIKVPLDDPWLGPLKVRCLEFLRSAPAHRRDCSLAWREQTNQVTSYLDASPVYSSSARQSDSARTFRNGLLIFGKANSFNDICHGGAISNGCIRAGDPRSSEQPGLLALNHVWVGEHNRIARELSDINPHWSDEKIYQETRRIIGALFQHITYREFLPLVLGREVCRLFDLELLNSGYYTHYDPHINPTVANSFSAAAFRFGHSLITGSYSRCDRNHNFLDNNVKLHEEFTRGDLENFESLQRLIRGMAAQRAQSRDEFITAELTNHLFQSGGFPFGLDLAAINIQRGRDHGIPRYTAWREPCGLSKINHWRDLESIIGPASTERMSHAYQSVHDIDLFVGGIAERPVIGGLVGPTFACIIAQQFSNLRKGDRFWYENPGLENSFTPAQLHSIRRVNFAQILCRAVGGGTFQPHIFIPPDVLGNERVPCGRGLLSPINLRPWLERDPIFDQNALSDLDTQETSAAIQHTNDLPVPNKLQNITQLDRIDLVPNGSTGIQLITNAQLIKNTTKVHDKLDFKQKPRPLKVTSSVNNKFNPNKNPPPINQLVLTDHKDNPINPLADPTLPGILLFNNVPITISPIFPDDTRARIRADIILHSGPKDSDKPMNRHINENDDNDRISTTKQTNDDILTTKIQITTDTNNETNFNNIKEILTKTNDRQHNKTKNLENTIITNIFKTFNNSQENQTITIRRQTRSLNDSKVIRIPFHKFTEFNQNNGTEVDSNMTASILSVLQTLQFNKNTSISNNLTNKYQTLNLKDRPRLTTRISDTTEIPDNITYTDDFYKEFTGSNILEVAKRKPYSKIINMTVVHKPDGKIEYINENKTIDSDLQHFDLQPQNDANEQEFKQSITDELIINNVPYVIRKKYQKGPDSLVDIIKKIFASNSGQSSLLITAYPNARFNFTYIKNTGKPNELRHRNTYPTYLTTSPINKPQKIVVAPTSISDEYEIEINIRPISLNNKKPLNSAYNNGPGATIGYFNNSLKNKYKSQSQSVNFQNYGQLPETFSHKKPILKPSSFNEKINYNDYRTKRPTIIYINEDENDNYIQQIPTKQTNNKPFQDLVTLDSNNNNNASPYYASIPPRVISSSSSSNYNNGIVNSISSSSSSASAYGSVATAFATASTIGNFGSISGTTSNGDGNGSPIFSVKIRPASSNTFSSKPFSTSSKPAYEFFDSNEKFSYANTNKFTSSPYSNRFPSNTDSYYNKPTIANPRPENYYDNFQILTRSPIVTNFNTISSKPYNYADINDEERSSRTKFNDIPPSSGNITHQNIETDGNTTTVKDFLVDYITNTDNNDPNDHTTDKIQFDEDGYLRPEHMSNFNFNTTTITTTTAAATTSNYTDIKTTDNTKVINDDYVLPILDRNKTIINYKTKTEQNIEYDNSTMYPDTIPRHPNFDIFAEDSFIDTDNAEQQIKKQFKNDNLVAFAPIKVLTRLERPDKWVIFNATENDDDFYMLQNQPEIKSEDLQSKEIPKPITRTREGILKSPITTKSPFVSNLVDKNNLLKMKNNSSKS